jgi:hypothetical protein
MATIWGRRSGRRDDINHRVIAVTRRFSNPSYPGLPGAGCPRQSRWHRGKGAKAMDEFTEHRKPLDTYIDDLAALQKESLAASAALSAEFDAAVEAVPDFPVTDQRLGLPVDFPLHQEVPCSIYFYYVRINTSGELYVRHYFNRPGNHKDPHNPVDPAAWPAIPNDDAALAPILQDMIDNARKGGGRYPLVGSDFLGIEWYRKSYIALFIDEANWVMHRGSSGNPALLFITTGGGTPNHSFFDGRNLDILMPEGDLRSAFLCINHMKKNAAGDDLAPGDNQLFQFKMFFDVNFAAGGRPLIVVFDPDGNNLGPPIGPP